MPSPPPPDPPSELPLAAWHRAPPCGLFAPPALPGDALSSSPCSVQTRRRNLTNSPHGKAKVKSRKPKFHLKADETSPSPADIPTESKVKSQKPKPKQKARSGASAPSSKSKRKSKADAQATEPIHSKNDLSEEEILKELVEDGTDGSNRIHWSDAVDSSDGERGVLSDGREDPGDGGAEARPAVEESDSSEDEVPDRNTVGAVPFEWYKEEEHIGYDITGKKIKKQAKKDKIDSFLNVADDPTNWRTIYDEYNDEEIELTKQEIKQIRKILKGKTPHTDINPYEPSIDWFVYKDKDHPVSNAPEPKRRFIPSKWEHKKVVHYIRAIRKGWIKFDKPEEEQPRFYLLWGDNSSSAENERRGLSYIPAPKPKLPGHEESYNPSVEYIPTQEEINSYKLMFEEDRPKFIPRRYESLRSVPAYDNALKEAFERLLDLYLCPRTRKKRLNIDPESLKPKLPSKKDLMPYPSACYLEYKGHTGPITSISVDVSGQWIASGSIDGTARIWEVETGRCLKVWEVDEAVRHVAWNPSSELSLIAVSVGQDVLLLHTGIGHAEQLSKTKELLDIKEPIITENANGNSTSVVRWIKHGKYEGLILKHFKDVTTVEWHRKGDYFCSVVPHGDSKAILIHKLSEKVTHNRWKKLHGLPVSAVFHPLHSIFFISTKKNIRVYDLLNEKLTKKLETGVREVSSIAIHPSGDNVIVGSREGKLCWFDMDLSSQPYKTFSIHEKDINNVAFHRSYPLFASCSDDGTAFVFHGMVYSDLNENPLIVPLKILRGHTRTNGRGVLDCKFHPRQPWLFTAGADSLIKLYCH